MTACHHNPKLKPFLVLKEFARRRMNFWVLSFCQVTVILLSFVTVASKFLEDKEWFKFGVVMTSCHYVILGTYCDILIEFSCNLYYSGVQKA